MAHRTLDSTLGHEGRKGDCTRGMLIMVPCVQTQQGRVSTASISQGGRHLLQGANSNQGTQQQTPSSPTSSAPAPEAPVQQGLTPAAAGQKSGYFGSGPFNNKVYSQSKPVQLSSLGLSKGVQYVVTTPVSVSGTARWASVTTCVTWLLCPLPKHYPYGAV